jgi:ABC-2 type transport system permease protein
MGLWRAWSTLVWLSFRRLVWSVNTFMLLFPLAGAAAFVIAGRRFLRYETEGEFAQAFVRFSEWFVVPLFLLFLLPICALAYATTSIGGDREDRTLLFLLVRPVPRELILLAKLTATLPLVVAIVTASFYVYCHLAGPRLYETAFVTYLPAVVYTASAYVCLFHLFAVLFRHSTIIALVYTLFMEAFLGNMPGVIKRVAVSFYGRSMIYRLAEPGGVEEPLVFQSISVPAATLWLWAISIGAVVLGMVLFSRREYRDLS